MPMNGCLKFCVEKDLETTPLKGQDSDWLAESFKGTGMEIGTTGIPYQFSSKSSLLINGFLLVSRTNTLES